MQIKCLHGFFIFEQESAGDAAFFSNTLGMDLAFENGHFTFSPLTNAPNYSIEGETYLGALALKTHEGTPWEIMKANGLIFDFGISKVIPIQSVTKTLYLKAAGQYYISNGLIMPGALTDGGKRVTDYAARYHRPSNQIFYSWVDYL